MMITKNNFIPYRKSKENKCSRILTVTDAYDAMTNDRCYRCSLSSKDAIGELESNAGTQFNPAIVKIYLQILQSGNHIH